MDRILVNVKADGETNRIQVDAGSTVGSVVNAALKRDFNVSDRAETLVNGAVASANTPLEAGDEISFRVAASSKSA